MHGISLNIQRFESPLTFTPDYYPTEEQLDLVRGQLSREVFEDSCCQYCWDGGYINPAIYQISAVFNWDAGDNGTYTKNVCARHLVDEVENFRDIGK